VVLLYPIQHSAFLIEWLQVRWPNLILSIVALPVIVFGAIFLGFAIFGAIELIPVRYWHLFAVK